MSPKIIPPTEVARAIAEALCGLAEAIETKAADATQQASDDCMRELSQMFTRKESLDLVKLIATPRARCAKCNLGRAVPDCSGQYCLECSIAIREASSVDTGAP